MGKYNLICNNLLLWWTYDDDVRGQYHLIELLLAIIQFQRYNYLYVVCFVRWDSNLQAKLFILQYGLLPFRCSWSCLVFLLRSGLLQEVLGQFCWLLLVVRCWIYCFLWSSELVFVITIIICDMLTLSVHCLDIYQLPFKCYDSCNSAFCGEWVDSNKDWRIWSFWYCGGQC